MIKLIIAFVVLLIASMTIARFTTPDVSDTFVNITKGILAGFCVVMYVAIREIRSDKQDHSIY